MNNNTQVNMTIVVYGHHITRTTTYGAAMKLVHATEQNNFGVPCRIVDIHDNVMFDTITPPIKD